MNTLLLRLAFSGIRSRLLASALTVLIAAAVAATVVIVLEVSATGRDPWQQTFDAAHGADVLADVSTREEAAAVAALPGVSEASGPAPRTLATLVDPRDEVGVAVAGLDDLPPVNKPLLTAGDAPTPGTVMLEQSLARALDLGVGDEIHLIALTPGDVPGTVGDGERVRFTVSGTAVLPSQPRFPRSNPGLVWVNLADLRNVQADESTWRWTQAVRLDSPESPDLFSMAVIDRFGAGNAGVSTKDQQRTDALLDTQPVVLIVLAYALVLLVVALAVALILVGTRAREQSREIGLLKAIGLTPHQVGRVFAIESGALGVVGVGVGFAIGSRLAPVLAGSFADTMVAAPTTAADPWHALVAAAPVLLVLVLGTWLAALRQSGMSVVNAINVGAAAPARRSAIALAVARLGLGPSLDLGVRNLLAVRSRAILLGLALVVTGAALVFALCVKASLDAARGRGPSDVPDGLPLLVYSLDVVLVVIATLGLVSVALISVRERLREFGILKTLGFTPGQVTLSVTGGSALVALLAGLASIPTGIALYASVYAATGGPSEGRIFASAGWLALVVLSIIALALITTSLPARLAARLAIAEALRHE